MERRKYIPASEEHEDRFRTTFRLKPQFADDPVCREAYEHAAKFRLWPDEFGYIAVIAERFDDHGVATAKEGERS